MIDDVVEMMKTDLVILIPSRGRPHSVEPLREAFRATATRGTKPIFVVDADDPTIHEYPQDLVLRGPRNSTMVKALNYAASLICHSAEFGPFAVGFMGDDHMPRTHGWDDRYLATLKMLGTGIVYGDDFLQGKRLPTQCAMTSDIVRALGKMAPHELRHMYVDNYWLQLGTLADCITYLPNAVIEHRHPLVNKAKWDDGYRRVNDPAVYAEDQLAFEDYISSGAMERDAQKVRVLRG